MAKIDGAVRDAVRAVVRRAGAGMCVLVLASCLSAGATCAFADDAATDDGDVTTEEVATADDAATDEEDADTTTEGSANTGVTEYNEEGIEVTEGVVSADDDRNARIFVGALATLAAAALVVALVWLVRSYRPRRAVERAAAQAAAGTGTATGKGHPALQGDRAQARAGKRRRHRES